MGSPRAASPKSLLSPAHKVYPIEDSTDDVAVFAEPLACVVHGMDVLDLRPGADVLMIGSGTTGLLPRSCSSTAEPAG